MRVIVPALLSLALCAPAGAATAPIDLSTEEGFRATCAAMPHTAAQLTGNAQRQAFAICRDVDLVRNIATFVSAAELHMKQQPRPSNAATRQLLRTELTLIRDELRTVRLVLEKLKLGKDDGLLLTPANWQLDLNGDGEMKPWERYFFAIPTRGKQAIRFGMPSNDPGYYQSHFQLDAAIRVDQGDVAWALSYHYFAEALVETVLSYTLNDAAMGRQSIELVDPAAMKRARKLMVRGFRTSELTRRAILAETDDEHEWIGHPGQRNSAFPIPLDKVDFEVWGKLLGHIVPLFEGRTLVAGDAKAGGFLGGVARFCAPGQGMNITRFYDAPPKFPLEPETADYPRTLCEPITKARPASGLISYIMDFANRAEGQEGAGMLFLRHLVWVN